MEHLLTTKAASLTELREPGKVLAESAGKAVAILNRNVVVAYLVPAEAVSGGHSKVSTEDALAMFDKRGKSVRPVLNYLKDK